MRSIETGVAAMSAVPKPYVSTRWPRARAASIEALAERVVGIDHRRAQAGPREELRLGGAVRGHRLVIVEMIAREVGEQRDVERRAVDAALVEAVRRHLHRHRARARGVELREQLVQHRDVGRRVRRRRERADEAVAERAEHRGAAAARIERLRDPLRARRLAVGAGDADHPQLRDGLP